MKKGIKILCIILALVLSFMLGWRVMPKVWPSIKENVVYRILPQLKPEPAQTENPDSYIPKSDYTFGDEIKESDSLILYFYKDYCPYCRQLEPLTAGLPKTITLPDGTESIVKLVGLNKVEEKFLNIITDYYNEYSIPEDRQYVPAIVIGDRYLFAGEEIIDQLLDALMAGEGLDTPMIGGGERTN